MGLERFWVFGCYAVCLTEGVAEWLEMFWQVEVMDKLRPTCSVNTGLDLVEFVH